MSNRNFHNRVFIANTLVWLTWGYVRERSGAEYRVRTSDGHDSLYRLLGKHIERARHAAALSQDKLAKMIGVTRASVVNIEHGRQRPPLHLIWEIATVLEVDPSELIPRPSELADHAESVQLDRAVVRQIQRVADDDPEARRLLTAFVQRATAQITSKDETDEPVKSERAPKRRA